MYAFDNWRSFDVTFDATKIPGTDASEAWRSNPLTKLVAFAGTGVERAASVRQVYPSGGELPENMLRFYIEFRADGPGVGPRLSRPRTSGTRSRSRSS